MYKIIKGERINSKNWEVEILHENEKKVWHFTRKPKLDYYGNPVYEIYPPFEDVENGLFTAGIIGRRNIRAKYYSSNGYVMVENINSNQTEKELLRNTSLTYILDTFYN